MQDEPNYETLRWTYPGSACGNAPTFSGVCIIVAMRRNDTALRRKASPSMVGRMSKNVGRTAQAAEVQSVVAAQVVCHHPWRSTARTSNEAPPQTDEWYG